MDTISDMHEQMAGGIDVSLHVINWCINPIVLRVEWWFDGKQKIQSYVYNNTSYKEVPVPIEIYHVMGTNLNFVRRVGPLAHMYPAGYSLQSWFTAGSVQNQIKFDHQTFCAANVHNTSVNMLF